LAPAVVVALLQQVKVWVLAERSLEIGAHQDGPTLQAEVVCFFLELRVRNGRPFGFFLLLDEGVLLSLLGEVIFGHGVQDLGSFEGSSLQNVEAAGQRVGCLVHRPGVHRSF